MIRSFFRNLRLAAVALLVAGVWTACNDDETEGGALQIYYPTVVDIGPSMTYMSGTPTYRGEAPTNFSIAGVTLDDAAIQTEVFSINADNGIITISNTDELATGCYKLSIACQSAGTTYTFKDAFTVQMSPSTPEAIELSMSVLEIPFDEIATTQVQVTVTPVGESVSILAYELIQPAEAAYFSISKQGVISLNENWKGEYLPGNYEIPIRITTYAGTKTYDNALVARITSAPLEVAYTPAAGRMEYNMPFESVVPTLKGSPDQVAWNIANIEPATDRIRIDNTTGVISVEAESELPIGETYTIDLTVSNEFGSTDFAAAYALTVIAYITPIDETTFGYEDAVAIQGGMFSAPKKEGFVGDEAIFSFGELPEGLAGQIAINAETGEISAQTGNTIAIGEYDIPVTAKNVKNEASAVCHLSVQDNPYFFTTIVYGNNLGLTPAADYANQYRANSAAELTALELVPTTDAREGTELTWSIKAKHQCSGTTIDSKTGVITPAGFKAGNGGLVLVTATAGKGKVGETTVTVPVFFSFNPTVAGVTVHYTPFVFQVNPRAGGVSAVPTVTGVEPADFLIDYRRTFNYYNIGGPATHIEGQPSVANSFMKQLWTNYYTSIGAATVNTGSKDPVSYYSNSSRLNSALCYVDPLDKSVVVNPNKWIDADNVAANGAFIGQMTFVTNGNQGGINSGSQIFPIWIWFDEKF